GFDPLAEGIFVNSLRVKNAAGMLVSTGNVSEYYVLDDQSSDTASQKKVLHIPVSGLQPGYSVELITTREYSGRSEEFPFLQTVLSRGIPVRETVLFLRGDTGAVRFASSPTIEPRALAGGLFWRLQEPLVYRWEPLQPILEDYLPTVWVADKSTLWPDLATNYLAGIRDRTGLPATEREWARSRSKSCTNAEQKIAAVGQYVQTNYTYKAIEFGRRARVPTRLTDTVRNRYGDCKDHALLAQQLLIEAGLRASLALVNTRSLIRQELPSLDQFNHMIVFVPGDDGGFLDCTDKSQKLGGVPLGLAGCDALVLDEKLTRFVRIPEYERTASRVEAARIVGITNQTDAAVSETLTFHGVSCAYLRSYLANVPASARRSYVVGLLGPNAELNELVIEHLEEPGLPLVLRLGYTLKNQFHSIGRELVGTLPVAMEQQYLAAGSVENRLTPFQFPSPLAFESTTVLNVPAGLRAKFAPRDDVKNRFLSCGFDGEQQAGSFTSRFRVFRAGGRHGAAEYPEFCASMNRTLAMLTQKLVLEPLPK
ncbi:MAG TPA: hypothetical protein VK530_10210, partial [Candidatus Acidoferrum sp.]|nr:hypothetical protein [Candidatus Acidoferrum sp.]